MFTGHIGVVTGGSSGIGRAIALRWAGLGGALHLVARDGQALESVAAEARDLGAPVSIWPCDLSDSAAVQALAGGLAARIERLDLLVHAAGSLVAASFEDLSLDQFDEQYATLARAPFALTRGLLPRLEASRGDVVFVNSSAAFAHAEQLTAYGAMKRALTGVADHLRTEVNPRGIRVLSVYPGRTATPMQGRVLEREGRTADRQRLLQPEDVASIVLHAVSLPPTAEVTEIRIRPMVKLQ